VAQPVAVAMSLPVTPVAPPTVGNSGGGGSEAQATARPPRMPARSPPWAMERKPAR
jgi:hypothetical protein